MFILSQYINRYEKFYLVINLARYLRLKSQIEKEGKEDTSYYGKINESTPSQNFVVLAEKQIEKDLREGIDVKEKYGAKFLETFILPKIEIKEEVTDND